MLVHEFCPEKAIFYPVTDQSINNYTFAFEPWLFEVYFTAFILKQHEEGLIGKHPIMIDKEYVYYKSK
jgi:hypothetical protein